MFGGMIEKEVDKVLDAIPDLPEKFNLQVREKQNSRASRAPQFELEFEFSVSVSVSYS